jgi:hypothetical protein
MWVTKRFNSADKILSFQPVQVGAPPSTIVELVDFTGPWSCRTMMHKLHLLPHI